MRFSAKQKEFLDEKFDAGERTGKKSNGEEVAEQMRRACTPGGCRLFSVDEFLTPQQISSYFSRKAAKNRKLTENDIVADAMANTLQQVASQVADALNDKENEDKDGETSCYQFNDLILCNMDKDELRRQKMTILKKVCSSHDIPGASGRKKEAYVEALFSYIRSNPCSRHIT